MIDGWLLTFWFQIHSVQYFLVFSFIFSCAQRVQPSHREARGTVSSRTTKSAKNLTKSKSVSIAAGAPKEASVKSKKSDSALDSIRLIRGKNINKKRQLKDKKDDSDSQHTELINVPLGKAGEQVPNTSKLAPVKESKSEKGKKVTFADKLVKSTITPSPTAAEKRSKRLGGGFFEITR